MNPLPDLRVFPITLPDGSKRLVDPLAAERRFIQALNGDPDTVLTKAAGKQPPEGFGPDGKPLPVEPETPLEVMQRLEAEDQLVKAVLMAFGLQNADELALAGGSQEQLKAALTNDEALRLVYEWLDWMEKKSPNTGSNPPSQPSTARSS
ncbi:MAG: hypothetical protein KGL39_29715 [Patescibacteria group bacterium]|nr:hypothetical protein [Patescibacteria group bacterium]